MTVQCIKERPRYVLIGQRDFGDQNKRGQGGTEGQWDSVVGGVG